MLRALLYALAWLVALAILIPLIYAVLGGFRDTGQISENPVGAARPVGVLELRRRS